MHGMTRQVIPFLNYPKNSILKLISAMSRLKRLNNATKIKPIEVTPLINHGWDA
jgi:hypothetical protein